MPSGSSLSSQDEGLTLAPSRSTTNGSADVTAELLDRWKSEIVSELKKEIVSEVRKAKAEIIEGN